MENKKKKILIVDDDQFLINMYSLKFRKDGFDVESATKGEEALEKLRGGLDPDIILLDVVMPSIDGFALLEKIKEEKFAEKSVIIMLTNQGQISDVDYAKKLDANGYIIKATTTPSEIVGKVMSIYDKRK